MSDKISIFGVTSNQNIVPFESSSFIKKGDIVLKGTNVSKSMLGSGVSFDKEGNSIIALNDGYLRLFNKKLFVDPIQIINGDLTHTFEEREIFSSLWVKGDFLNKNKLIIFGNLQVDGVIENPDIICQGNIIVNGSILGQGTGRIVVQGDCFAQNVSGVKIVSYGEVIVRDYIRHSNIFAKSLTIVNSSGEICDSSIFAKNSVKSGKIGSKNIINTSISVGYNYREKFLLNRYKKELKILKITYNKNLQTIRQYFNISEGEEINLIDIIMKNLQTSSNIYLLKVLESIKLSEDIAYNTEKIQNFNLDNMTNLEAFIDCETIYPGVNINILDKSFQIINTININTKINRSNCEQCLQQ